MNLESFSETKDDSIRSLLRAVESAAVSARIEVVDHWDADRHAIGFHRVGAAQPLLYVTTWQLPSGSYRWYLESTSERRLMKGSSRRRKRSFSC